MWGLSAVTDEFPSQRTSTAEDVSIWWRHHFKGRVWLLLCWYNILYWNGKMLFLNYIQILPKVYIKICLFLFFVCTAFFELFPHVFSDGFCCDKKPHIAQMVLMLYSIKFNLVSIYVYRWLELWKTQTKWKNSKRNWYGKRIYLCVLCVCCVCVEREREGEGEGEGGWRFERGRDRGKGERELKRRERIYIYI